MNEAMERALHDDAADTEVELSAEDLIALSHPQPAKSDAVLIPAQSMPTVGVRTRESSAPTCRAAVIRPARA